MITSLSHKLVVKNYKNNNNYLLHILKALIACFILKKSIFAPQNYQKLLETPCLRQKSKHCVLKENI